MSGLKMIAQEKDIRIHIMLEVFTNNWSSKNETTSNYKTHKKGTTLSIREVYKGSAQAEKKLK